MYPPPSPVAHVTETPGHSDSLLVTALREAYAQALTDETRLTETVLALEGMSGRRYRKFINALVGRIPAARYLEVGSWTGSTLCAAVHGNRARAFAIDNWSMFGGPIQQFLRNVADCDSADVDFNMLTEDFRAVDYARIGRFNVYLYDGPHSHADQYDGLRIAQPALDDEYVFVVDDWNWPQVREGTHAAIRDLRLEVLHAIEVRTSLDGTQPEVIRQFSDWHNGYWLSVLRKTR